MREIKFRAWQQTPLPQMIGPDEFDNLGQFFSASEGNGWVLMQFTGLKDKNGVEIYEGDIIKTSWHKHEVVMGWGDDNEQYRKSYGWCLRDLEEDGSEYREANPLQIIGSSPDDYNEEWEVIGNIYENPELLNV